MQQERSPVEQQEHTQLLLPTATNHLNPHTTPTVLGDEEQGVGISDKGRGSRGMGQGSWVMGQGSWAKG